MSDWEQFLHTVTWFLGPGESASVGEPQPWDRGSIDGLPALSALLAAATRTPLSVGDTPYELLAWGPTDKRRGWLCRPPHDTVDDSVPAIHRSFWKVCGGFIEQFGGPSTWWENQNEVLTVDATRESIEEPLDAYRWIWENDGLEVPIDPREYYPVAVEANGNLTLARRDDGLLLLFAPDHAFERVTPFAGSPPCSLLVMDEVPDLATWIEVCAVAWYSR